MEKYKSFETNRRRWRELREIQFIYTDFDRSTIPTNLYAVVNHFHNVVLLAIVNVAPQVWGRVYVLPLSRMLLDKGRKRRHHHNRYELGLLLQSFYKCPDDRLCVKRRGLPLCYIQKLHPLGPRIYSYTNAIALFKPSPFIWMKSMGL